MKCQSCKWSISQLLRENYANSCRGNQKFNSPARLCFGWMSGKHKFALLSFHGSFYCSSLLANHARSKARSTFLWCEAHTCGPQSGSFKEFEFEKNSEFFRIRLQQIGIWREDVKMYIWHSIKRFNTAISLNWAPRWTCDAKSADVRSTRVRELLRSIIYYNDCSPTELLRFSSVEDYVKHAKKLQRRSPSVTTTQRLRSL